LRRKRYYGLRHKVKRGFSACAPQWALRSEIGGVAVLKAVNLGLKFVLELAAFAALA
jgi:hypothetical protein